MERLKSMLRGSCDSQRTSAEAHSEVLADKFIRAIREVLAAGLILDAKIGIVKSPLIESVQSIHGEAVDGAVGGPTMVKGLSGQCRDFTTSRYRSADRL